MAATFRTYLELVRFSHTIFAMPFAIMAAMIALHFGGDPVWQSQPWQWVQSVIGVLLCMVSARTAAMAFNRLVDRTIDAVNPRTASRHLPRGDLQAGEVLCLIVAASVAFVASTLLFLPNWLPLVLSVPVLAGLQLCQAIYNVGSCLVGLGLGTGAGRGVDRDSGEHCAG